MTELIDGLYYEGEKIADTKAPHSVPIDRRWEQRKFEAKLVNPANRRKLDIIVVGSGLAGGAAAASLGEQGYNVKVFFYQDSARRAHSIAAQGGINAAKNYRNDGDSVYRLFYDTVKGGDYRAREDNVYRLAEVSANIIDQCVAQGVPFAREYGGLLDNRSFGGVQVSRTFYARGQTGQQLLIGAYQALERQVHAGTVKEFRRHEMVELIIVDGRARGIVTRDMVSGKIETHLADAVVLASGGYGNVFFLSTNAMGCNATAVWRAHRKGAYFANPCYTQIHPTCIPQSGDFQSKLTLMSESLRNDGRIWVPKKAEDCDKDPRDIPEEARDYYLERIYPAFGNLVPRDIASRQAKNMCDEGRGVGPAIKERDANGNERMMRRGVYLDFSEAIDRLGKDAVSARYGNLFEMYQRITGDDPYEVPMRIYPAVHYTMGGLWVDYDLESNVPGLYIAGEANFSDHGANRLGASALMQGLADGYFVLPDTHERLPGGHAAPGQGRPQRPGDRRGQALRRGARRPPHGSSRHPQRGRLPHGPGPHHVGVLRHGTARCRTARRHQADPGPQGGVLARRPHYGPGRRAQPGPGEGRPTAGLLRAGRAHVHRRPAPAGVLRWPLPGGVPDSRG